MAYLLRQILSYLQLCYRLAAKSLLLPLNSNSRDFNALRGDPCHLVLPPTNAKFVHHLIPDRHLVFTFVADSFEVIERVIVFLLYFPQLNNVRYMNV